MNRALLNPFEAADLPRGIEEVLEQDSGTCMRFNRHGNLLAVGTRSGQVILWDFDTLSIACVLAESKGASHEVTSLSFPAPRNGSMVLVSFANGLVRLYDTLSRSVASEIQFDVPITQALAHPKRPAVAIVVPRNSHPLVLHMRRGVYEARAQQFNCVHDPKQLIYFLASPQQRDVLGESVPLQMPQRPKNAFGNHIMATVPNKEDFVMSTVLCTPEEFEEGVSKENSGTRRKSPFCVAFTRSAEFILRGGQTGLIRTFKLEQNSASNRTYFSPVCTSVVVVPGKSPIRSIQLTFKGNNVLVNSLDRSMRLFFLDQILEPPTKDRHHPPVMHLNTTFAEHVNKVQCQSACFSRDGDFVLGGMDGTDHRIHVWRAVDGFLDLTLEGPRERIVEILWHPVRPVFTSLSASGSVYVWMKNFTENWSAFAAEFNELEANEEYVEAEDEFDLKDPEDEEKRVEQREKEEAKDVNIDVCDQLGWFSSDSDEGDTYFYVPAVPAPDSDKKYDLLSDRILAEKGRESGRDEFMDLEVSKSSGAGEAAQVRDIRRKRKPGDGPTALKPSKPKRLRSSGRKRSSEMNGDRNDKKSTCDVASNRNSEIVIEEASGGDSSAPLVVTNHESTADVESNQDSRVEDIPNSVNQVEVETNEENNVTVITNDENTMDMVTNDERTGDVLTCDDNAVEIVPASNAVQTVTNDENTGEVSSWDNTLEVTAGSERDTVLVDTEQNEELRIER